MAKKCEISGTGVMSGNNVSHANNRTRRRFLPNLQVVSLLSEALGKVYKLRICTKTLRSIEHKGGLDAYLMATPDSKLSEEAKKHNSSYFTIPFNRQQLADYLSVDRSAMSNELCKMRDDGLLEFEKNNFRLL